jgi:hypothetical protein
VMMVFILCLLDGTSGRHHAVRRATSVADTVPEVLSKP